MNKKHDWKDYTQFYYDENGTKWVLEDNAQSAISALKEHKRLLFEANGRLLEEKESGLWDHNHPIRKELETLRANFNIVNKTATELAYDLKKARKELETLKELDRVHCRNLDKAIGALKDIDDICNFGWSDTKTCHPKCKSCTARDVLAEIGKDNK